MIDTIDGGHRLNATLKTKNNADLSELTDMGDAEAGENLENRSRAEYD